MLNLQVTRSKNYQASNLNGLFKNSPSSMPQRVHHNRKVVFIDPLGVF